jgi:hypothetical protein
VGDHLDGRAVGHDVAVGQHDCPVRHLGHQLDVVGGQQDGGPPLAQLVQPGGERALAR